MGIELVFDGDLLFENLRKEGWKEGGDILKALFDNDYSKLGYFVLFQDANEPERHAIRGFEGRYFEHRAVQPPRISGFAPMAAGGGTYRLSVIPPVREDDTQFFKDLFKDLLKGDELRNRIDMHGYSHHYGKPDWAVVGSLAPLLAETELYKGFEINIGV